MTEQVEQQIYIKFCIKLEHSSVETIGMIQKAAAMGNWWLAASLQQLMLQYIAVGKIKGRKEGWGNDEFPIY